MNQKKSQSTKKKTSNKKKVAIPEKIKQKKSNEKKIHLEKFKEVSEKLKADLELKHTDNLLKNSNSEIKKKVKIIKFLTFLFAIIYIASVTYSCSMKQNQPIEKSANITLFKAEGKEAIFMGDSADLPDDLREVKGAAYVKIPIGHDTAKAAQKIQQQYSLSEKLPLEVQNSLGMKFRLVPPGKFLMGSPKTEKGRGETEKLHENEILRPLYVGKFEVTQDIWTKIMGKNPSFYKKPYNPVEETTLYNCVKFIIQLNKYLKVPPKTYRLLREKEWEYSCRAGTTTAFFFGNNFKALAKFENIKASSFRSKPIKVGSKSPNGWGLFDMHGNVSEWTRTRFAMYDWAKNTYSDTWDIPIYDGQSPKLKALKKFFVKRDQVGTITNVYYHDKNANDTYNSGEDIWKDMPEGRVGYYDEGIDIRIFGGPQVKKDNWETLPGIPGTQTDLFYYDKNNNNEWDHAESFWKYSSTGRKSLQYVYRGGNFYEDAPDSRSAMRWRLTPTSNSNMIGFRIVRDLRRFIKSKKKLKKQTRPIK